MKKEKGINQTERKRHAFIISRGYQGISRYGGGEKKVATEKMRKNSHTIHRSDKK